LGLSAQLAKVLNEFSSLFFEREWCARSMSLFLFDELPDLGFHSAEVGQHAARAFEVGHPARLRFGGRALFFAAGRLFRHLLRADVSLRFEPGKHRLILDGGELHVLHSPAVERSDLFLLVLPPR